VSLASKILNFSTFLATTFFSSQFKIHKSHLKTKRLSTRIEDEERGRCRDAGRKMVSDEEAVEEEEEDRGAN
jgi:hypothetical protein